jgi:hypothetical protein
MKLIAFITDDVSGWNSCKDTWKFIKSTPNLHQQSSIVTDTDKILEFADGVKYVRIGLNSIREECAGQEFDEVKYMKDTVFFKDIKIGMMLVPDLDGFMLGNRWLVTGERDGGFYAEHFSCGKRNPYVSSDWIIKDDPRGYWTKVGETLSNWICQHNKIGDKIILR